MEGDYEAGTKHPWAKAGSVQHTVTFNRCQLCVIISSSRVESLEVVVDSHFTDEEVEVE